MVTEVDAAEFKQRPGPLLDRVHDLHDTIVISEDGKTVAALVDPSLYDRLQRMSDLFEDATAKIASAFHGIPEEEGMALIDAAIAEARRE